jgi:hypothetical protein
LLGWWLAPWHPRARGAVSAAELHGNLAVAHSQRPHLVPQDALLARWLVCAHVMFGSLPWREHRRPSYLVLINGGGTRRRLQMPTRSAGMCSGAAGCFRSSI